MRAGIPDVYPSNVDKKVLLRHLDEARTHIALGDKHIARQREIVAEFEKAGDGDDLVTAKALLESYMQLQAMHIADLQGIERELLSDSAMTEFKVAYGRRLN